MVGRRQGEPPQRFTPTAKKNSKDGDNVFFLGGGGGGSSDRRSPRGARQYSGPQQFLLVLGTGGSHVARPCCRPSTGDLGTAGRHECRSQGVRSLGGSRWIMAPAAGWERGEEEQAGPWWGKRTSWLATRRELGPSPKAEPRSCDGNTAGRYLRCYEA